MKLTMRVTLDGMMRALRLEAHRLADDIEAVYVDGGMEDFDVEGRSREPIRVAGVRMRATSDDERGG